MPDVLRKELNQAFSKLEWSHYQRLIDHYGLPKDLLMLWRVMADG